MSPPPLGRIGLRCSYFFGQFQPKCSYKLGSNKKKRVSKFETIIPRNFTGKHYLYNSLNLFNSMK